VFLYLLYGNAPASNTPVSHMMPPKEDRNREIYQRYIDGARAVDLAAEYGISLQRVYVIIRRGQYNQQ
jgi:Mor family transcriptional regulator